MGRTERLFRHLTDRLELQGEALPGQSILELLGDGRVLVENHEGILQYSLDQLTVGTSFGRLLITGEALRLTHMSGQLLIISGGIRRIDVSRREDP